MLTGMPPFYNKDRQKLFNTIKAIKIKFPKYLSNDAVDLLQKFFVKDPEQRLGSGENGLNDIKSHPFFSPIDWDSLIEKKIKPPFIPKLKNDTDLRYFDTMFTDEPIDGPQRKCTNRDRDREPSNEYNGFSYVTGSVSNELVNLAKAADNESI